MDDLRPTKRPKISTQSRIFKHGGAGRTSTSKDKGKQAVRTRNAGKLATLMSITLDIFFEIITHLRPVDLLQLCRVSKHFRTTFMSKSSRSLWIAARKNGDVLPVPEPLPGMSEPYFASLLFEHNCFACGAGRASKVDFALGSRFCAACAKFNLREGYNLLRKYCDLPDTVLGLIPMQADAINRDTPPIQRKASLCYVTEFEDVVTEYRELSRPQSEDSKRALDEFITRRHEYVASVAKHAQAITIWADGCSRINGEQCDEVQQKRKASIKEKLSVLGYTEDDFPVAPYWGCPAARTWGSIVEQPKELTERIWKNIQGKLVKALEDFKIWRAEMQLVRRKVVRQSELRRRYVEWAENSALDDGPYPSLPELLSFPETIAMVNEDNSHIEIDQERFDRLMPLFQEYKNSTRAALVRALRSTVPSSADTAEDGAVEVHSEAILYNATSLFRNPHNSHGMTGYGYCFGLFFQHKVFSFSELLRDLHDVYTDGDPFPSETTVRYEPDTGVAETARAVLKAVGLSEDTQYDEVDKRIICLCHKAGLDQPASFSKLINHVHIKQLHHREVRAMTEETYSATFGCDFINHDDSDDHDFESGNTLFRLLDKDEVYAPEETASTSDG